MAYVEPIERYKNGKKVPKEKCRTWRIYAYEGVKDPKTKRYRRHTKNVHNMTWTEANAEAARFEAEVKQNNTSTMRWAEWCDKWLEQREKDPDLSPSTIKRDKWRMRTLKALMGNVRLCDIDVKHCEAIIRQLKTEGSPAGKKDLKPSYIASIETSISELLEEAVRCGLRKDNPMRHVKKRTKKNNATHENAPDMEEIHDIVSKLDPRNKYHMAVLLAVRVGLRRGEILGLRWKDVDFKRKTIRIRKALKDDNKLGPPKTPSSVRAITLTKDMETALKARRKYQEDNFEYMVRAKVLPTMPDMKEVFVCCHRTGDPMTLQAVDAWWGRHRNEFGTDATLHELRHGFITMMAELGVHPATTAAAVGHKTPLITLEVYTHVNTKLVDQAMELVEEALTIEIDDGSEIQDEED